LAAATEKQNRFLSEGIRNMMIATFSFALMNVFVKQMPHLPAMEIVFFRCLVSLIACYIGLRGKNVNWIGNNNLYLFLRGAFGTTALFTFFLTLQNIPLASAVTIQYLSPIFTTIIAVVLFSEKIRPLHWLFFALSFAGVVAVKGFQTDFPFIFLMIGMVSAFCSGMAYNLVRSLKEKEYPLVVVLHFQFVGVAAGLIYIFFDWKTPVGIDWLFLLLTGICTQMGQVHLTKALQAEQVSKVSIVGYLGIIYALIFGWTLFGETYTVQTIAGIFMVIFGVLLSILYSRRTAIAESIETTQTG
jgi:drug/metabolite transporter (DMT)-like permease